MKTVNGETPRLMRDKPQNPVMYTYPEEREISIVIGTRCQSCN